MSEKKYEITESQRQTVINLLANSMHPNTTFAQVNDALNGLTQLPECNPIPQAGKKDK